MDYREFKKAAHRHLISCQKMCEALANANASEMKNALVSDIYYLSGYVVETLLSYAFFCSCDQKTREKPIEDHPEYEKGFKTHNFQSKISFVKKHQCNLDGFDFISQSHPNKKYMNLFNSWQVELRYTSLSGLGLKCSIDEQIITGYVEALKKLESQILRKYI